MPRVKATSAQTCAVTSVNTGNTKHKGGKKKQLNTQEHADAFYYGEPQDCPLCCEAIDNADADFCPCPCGYQVCPFCYNKLRTEYNGLCPGCRTPYVDGMPAKTVRKEKDSGPVASPRRNTAARCSSQRSAPPPPPAQHPWLPVAVARQLNEPPPPPPPARKAQAASVRNAHGDSPPSGAWCELPAAAAPRQMPSAWYDEKDEYQDPVAWPTLPPPAPPPRRPPRTPAADRDKHASDASQTSTLTTGGIRSHELDHADTVAGTEADHALAAFRSQLESASSMESARTETDCMQQSPTSSFTAGARWPLVTQAPAILPGQKDDLPLQLHARDEGDPQARTMLRLYQAAVDSGQLSSADAAAQLAQQLRTHEQQRGATSQLARGKLPPGFSSLSTSGASSLSSLTSSRTASMEPCCSSSSLGSADNVVEAPRVASQRPICAPGAHVYSIGKGSSHDAAQELSDVHAQGSRLRVGGQVDAQWSTSSGLPGWNLGFFTSPDGTERPKLLGSGHTGMVSAADVATGNGALVRQLAQGHRAPATGLRAFEGVALLAAPMAPPPGFGGVPRSPRAPGAGSYLPLGAGAAGQGMELGRGGLLGRPYLPPGLGGAPLSSASTHPDGAGASAAWQPVGSHEGSMVGWPHVHCRVQVGQTHAPYRPW